MAARYTADMPQCQPRPARARAGLPLLWLLSDARNDAGLEAALAALPPASGFVFRHHHLPPAERAARFRLLAQVARRSGHIVVLAGNGATAREWGADGVYGPAASLAGRGALLGLATAHDGAELALAQAAAADGVFLSPVFPTRSHPEAVTLGIHGFHVLAQQSTVPVIALGGMTRERADELGWSRWGAIDGLSCGLASPQDS